MTKSCTISMGQRFKIGKRLEEVLEKDGDDHVKYKPGHDDKSISLEFGVHYARIRDMRCKVFGQMRNTNNGRGMITRLANIERRLTALEEAMTRSLEREHTAAMGGKPAVAKSFSELTGIFPNGSAGKN